MFASVYFESFYVQISQSKKTTPLPSEIFGIAASVKGSTLNVYDCWAYLPVPLARRLKVKPCFAQDSKLPDEGKRVPKSSLISLKIFLQRRRNRTPSFTEKAKPLASLFHDRDPDYKSSPH
jgi:hypothetical protein